MLMSTKQFGGCSNVKIDCDSTSYKDILELYANHSTEEQGPPEGDLRTVQYAACCVRHNCESGPACGEPPWDATKDRSKQLKDGESPCGIAGCERLYDTGLAAPRPRATKSSLVAATFAAAAGMFVAGLLTLRWISQQTMFQQVANTPLEADEEAVEAESLE